VICLCELQLYGTAEVTVGSAKPPRLRVRPRTQGWALVIFTEPSVEFTANRSESLCENKQLQCASQRRSGTITRGLNEAQYLWEMCAEQLLQGRLLVGNDSQFGHSVPTGMSLPLHRAMPASSNSTHGLCLVKTRPQGILPNMTNLLV
jgi:hypothetical protein